MWWQRNRCCACRQKWQPQNGSWIRIPILIGIEFKRRERNLSLFLDRVSLVLPILVTAATWRLSCKLYSQQKIFRNSKLYLTLSLLFSLCWSLADLLPCFLHRCLIMLCRVESRSFWERILIGIWSAFAVTTRMWSWMTRSGRHLQILHSIFTCSCKTSDLSLLLPKEWFFIN